MIQGNAEVLPWYRGCYDKHTLDDIDALPVIEEAADPVECARACLQQE